MNSISFTFISALSHSQPFSKNPSHSQKTISALKKAALSDGTAPPSSAFTECNTSLIVNSSKEVVESIAGGVVRFTATAVVQFPFSGTLAIVDLSTVASVAFPVSRAREVKFGIS